MAAAVIPAPQCAIVRTELLAIATGQPPRLHWRDMERDERESVSKTVAHIPQLTSVVLVAAMVDPRKQERARHRVLQHLLIQLDRRQVHRAVLESRRTAQDAADNSFVGELRRGRHIGRRLTVEHAGGRDQPLLWLPDAVAGAAGDQRHGDPTYLSLMGPRIVVIDAGTC